MLDLLKDLIGVTTNDYDIYIIIIGCTGLLWAVKSVISGILTAITNIFR